MKTIINSKNAPAPIGPYSQAVLAGNTLFASGQIAINPATGELEMASIEIETEQVMQNIKAVLEETNMSFENIVKCSIFLSSMGSFSKVNEVYGKYFPLNPPARETVEVSCLPKSVNVEISFIAIK
ncbi:MAG: RidA family protein [Bacteroidetes bacterium]|nr:RidA family protein [Bacteroidota bacterium]MDB4344404.1 RidA family protein [bacterium]